MTVSIRFPKIDPAEQEEFYARLGMAITVWARVEANLFQIYLFALSAPAMGPAAAAYHTIMMFKAKLDATVAGIDVFELPEAFDMQWKSLVKRMRDGADDRNKLAHWIVVGGLGDEGRRIWLSTNWDNPRFSPRRTGKARKKLFTSDIAAMAGDFGQLADDLGEFYIAMQDAGLTTIVRSPPPRKAPAKGRD